MGKLIDSDVAVCEGGDPAGGDIGLGDFEKSSDLRDSAHPQRRARVISDTQHRCGEHCGLELPGMFAEIAHADVSPHRMT